MASISCATDVQRTLIIIFLLLVQISASFANRSPEISMGLPYTGKTGVLTLSEETPVNSYLAIMEIKDKDSGPAGEVECRTNNNYINISLVYPKTYKVELAKQLDRETASVLPVTILCSDKGFPPKTSTANFTIEVMDVNDNAPIFARASYSANITEGVDVGTLVTTVMATDPDSELNGVVQYSLYDDSLNDSSNFTIDEKTGQVFTNTEIDRESVDQYNLTVIATDSGLPALSSMVQVIIKVNDVNDNAPVILTKEFQVKENQKPMGLVGTLASIDLDIGRNAELVYSKVEDSQSSSTTPFLIQSNGEVLSAVSLDRELRPQYTMEVAVRDKGNPRQSDTAIIIITVVDVNDNAPVITSPCLYDSDLNLRTLGSNTSGFVVIDWYSPDDERVVYQTEAEDEDIGENALLHFATETVTIGDTSNTTSTITNDPLFEINEDTGAIFLRRFVRFNDHLRQILNISVTDKGSPPLTAFCAINITINVDPAHLTTPKPTNTRSRPKKRGRAYRNGASFSGFLAINCVSGQASIITWFLLAHIFMNDL